MHHAPLKCLSVWMMAGSFLSACGGGGGENVRAQAPPPAPALTCADARAENPGGSLPCVYRYTGSADNLLVGNNADLAHAQGVTGAGIVVGMVDAFNDGTYSAYSALNGKIISYDERVNWDGSVRSSQDHLLLTGSVLAGRPVHTFRGGIAPDAAMRYVGVCAAGMDGCSSWNPLTAVRTLLNYGDVRLVSIILGGNEDGTVIAPAQRNTWQPLFSLLRDADALLVSPVGNENQPNPAPMAQFSHLAPEYYGHQIAAMAIHIGRTTDPWGGGADAANHPNYDIYRAAYSNACGVSAQWCVGAVSNIRLPEAGAQDSVEWKGGTSVSAPTVAGVAALVMEAYPWMSASNVQQTVLTTATDIGEPGVDPVFGWGLVDARKAIDGPAQFVSNGFVAGFTANVEGESRPFFNDISGEGWLFKTGTGSLTLAGRNTYTGGTRVESGELRVTGALGSDVEVAPGAVFATGGAGARIDGNYRVWDAARWNAALPAAEHLSGDAVTAIQIGAALNVSQTAWLDGHLRLLPEAENYTVKAREPLITAGRVEGAFKAVEYGSGFFWTAKVQYTATSVDAELTRASARAQAMALAAPARVVDGAGMADALIGYADRLVESGQRAGHESLLAATAQLISAPNDETAALSLSSLTGEIHAAARQLGLQRALNDGGRLVERLHLLGVGGAPGLWVQNDSGQRQLNRSGYGTAEVHHSASGIGMDEHVGEHWTLGIAALRAYSNAHLDGVGGYLTGSGHQMAVYAHFRPGRRAYLSGLFSHDRHTIDTRRQVLAGDAPGSVIGQHIDKTTLLRLETGVPIALGLTPYFAAGRLSLRQGGFSESGILGLAAGADTFSANFAEFGTRFDHTWGRWTLASTLLARRMSGADTGFNAAFTGAEAVGLRMAGQPLNRRSVRFDQRFGYRARNGWQSSLAFSSEYAEGQPRNLQVEAALGRGW